MSKAEDKAKAFLKKLVSHTTLYKGTIDEVEVYEPDDVIWAYKEGYRQAEKDMELGWEDVKAIFLLVQVEWSPNKNEEEIYQEVLKRFIAIRRYDERRYK